MRDVRQVFAGDADGVGIVIVADRENDIARLVNAFSGLSAKCFRAGACNADYFFVLMDIELE